MIGPSSQVSGRIMGRGTDDFYPVRVRPDGKAGRRGTAGRKPWWMLMTGRDEPFKEIRAHDLHVAGHHHEFYPRSGARSLAAQPLRLHEFSRGTGTW